MSILSIWKTIIPISQKPYTGLAIGIMQAQGKLDDIQLSEDEKL